MARRWIVTFTLGEIALLEQIIAQWNDEGFGFTPPANESTLASIQKRIKRAKTDPGGICPECGCYINHMDD